MAHSLSMSALGNFDLSPYITGNSLGSFGKPYKPAMARPWQDHPEYPVHSSFGRRDEVGRDGEARYDGAWSLRGDGGSSRNWDGADGSLRLEQCHSEHCFFGCGITHSVDTGFGGIRYDEFDVHGQGGEIDVEWERSFGILRRLESDRYPRLSLHNFLMVDLSLRFIPMVLCTMDVMHLFPPRQLNPSITVIAGSLNHSMNPVLPAPIAQRISPRGCTTNIPP